MKNAHSNLLELHYSLFLAVRYKSARNEFLKTKLVGCGGGPIQQLVAMEHKKKRNGFVAIRLFYHDSTELINMVVHVDSISRTILNPESR